MHTEKNPENVVFMDREHELRIKPDVLADFTMIPFRDGVFDYAVFDPPHLINKSTKIRSKWLHSDPFEGRTKKFKYGGWPRTTYGSWWGFFRSGEEMRRDIALAADEIHRVLRRDGLLHFKWNNAMVKVMSTIVSFKRNWSELYRTDRQTGTNVSDSRTYWVLFQKRGLGAYRGSWREITLDAAEVEDVPKLDEYFADKRKLPQQVKLSC